MIEGSAWNRFFIVTGGPGAGNNSLLAALASAGYARTGEAAEASSRTRLVCVLFDRDVPDVPGCLRLMGHRVPRHMQLAAQIFGYNRSSACCSSLAGHLSSGLRAQARLRHEAVPTHNALVETYLAQDYELIKFPRAPVEEWVRFGLPLLNRWARPQ